MPLSRFSAAFLMLILSLSILTASVHAQDVRSVDVRFPRGTSGTTLSDTVAGYQGIDYRLGVSTGQLMSVRLDTDNASNYFNITAPGASEALFVGSISGNSASIRIPSSGTYVISVYLMRNAAGRGETANFDLTLYVQGAAASTPQPQPLPQPVPDFADGLQGGPDYWVVEGLGGTPLNVRSGPATSYGVIGNVRNGDRLRNLGCTMNGSTRWCQVDPPRSQRGWVAGRYLHESFNQPTTPPAQSPRPLPQPTPPNPTPDQLSTGQMPRFCAGEASAQFGVRPTEITTNMAFQSGSNYVVQGYFDRDGGTTFFNCWFGLDGRFNRLS